MGEAMARYLVVDICRQVGICRDTLLDWEQQKKIPKAQRDRNGWRYWEDAERDQIVTFASGPPAKARNQRGVTKAR